jgi:hypothetical protein
MSLHTTFNYYVPPLAKSGNKLAEGQLNRMVQVGLNVDRRWIFSGGELMPSGQTLASGDRQVHLFTPRFAWNTAPVGALVVPGNVQTHQHAVRWSFLCSWLTLWIVAGNSQILKLKLNLRTCLSTLLLPVSSCAKWCDPSTA